MRPLRSFLLLLIFLACFTGLHYIIPANHLFPAIGEFFSPAILNTLKSTDPNAGLIAGEPGDTSGAIRRDTILIPFSDTDRITPGKTTQFTAADTSASKNPILRSPEITSENPLQGFLDSLKYSKGQI
jgi:hypothetical protein